MNRLFSFGSYYIVERKNNLPIVGSYSSTKLKQKMLRVRNESLIWAESSKKIGTVFAHEEENSNLGIS